jgi:uncharacterized membrane protein YphA (DoxX/SURF4 family)
MFALQPLLFKTVPWLQSLALLAIRLFFAKVFWEAKIPILNILWPSYAETAGELILPVLLILGFLTPLCALGMMPITLWLWLWQAPGSTQHYYWFMLAGILVSFGSGRFGMDYWLWKRG